MHVNWVRQSVVHLISLISFLWMCFSSCLPSGKDKDKRLMEASWWERLTVGEMGVGSWSVQFSHSVMSDSLWPHGLQHARPPCPSPVPSLLKLLSTESVMPSNHLILCRPLFLLPSIFLSFRSFLMSQFFTSGGQNIGVSASTSVFPMNIQDWFPSGFTGWISLQSKGFSRVFSNTTVQKHQFFSAQLSLYAQQIFNPIFFWWTGLCSLSLVDLRPNYGGGNDDNYNLLQNVPGRLCHHWPTPPIDTPGHSQASLGQSLVGSLLLSPGSWCARGFVCALQESVSPVMCKFWRLYGGVNGDLLQEGLCHTQVCCTQSSCPCSRPLLTRSSAGDTQTLKGRCGSVSVGSPGAHKVWVEPSDHLW